MTISATVGSTPINKNFLSQLEFRFILRRAPHIVFFLTGCNVPGISLGSADVPTPFVVNPQPGDHLDFELFQIQFKVDEELNNWREIYNWIHALGDPVDGSYYRALANAAVGGGAGLLSDATLTINSNMQKPNIRINFENMWPTSLDSLRFDSTSADVEYISSSATFKYLKYTVERV